MAQKDTNKGGTDMGTKMEVALGIGALAALSAGAYFLYGTKEGAKRRVKIKGWMLKAKGEVLEKLETLKDVNEDSYNAVVASVLKKYTGLKDLPQSEVDALFHDIRSHWKNIKKHIADNKPKASGKAKATVKRVAKKAATKVTK